MYLAESFNVFQKDTKLICLLFFSLMLLFLLFFGTELHATGTYTVIEDVDGIFFQTNQDGSWSISPDDLRFFRIGESGAYKIRTDNDGTFIETNKKRKFYIDDTAPGNLYDGSTNFKTEPLKEQTVEKETRVTIIGNRILVPVKLGHRYREINTQLLLDTGASVTTINRDVARRLKLHPTETASFRLADGRVIQAGVGNLSYVRVGPIKKRALTVAILDSQGPTDSQQGLLGINFLKGSNYRIDYDRQVIQWLP